MNNKKIHLLLIAVIAVVFVLSVIHLFLLRFKSGDVYPAYSTLRSDPLGTRALYQSLENLNVFYIKRNFTPLTQVKFEQKTTFLYLGARDSRSAYVPKYMADAFDDLTDKGGRLVITFYPTSEWFFKQKDGEKDKVGKKVAKEETDPMDTKQEVTPRGKESSQKSGHGEDKKDDENGLEEDDKKRVSLGKHWGVSLGYEGEMESIDAAKLNSEYHSGELPRSISWHTALFFKDLSEKWRVIYTRNGYPVMIERSFKNGMIVLSSDTYFLSNEGLWAERYPSLIAYIMGNNDNLVFDEGHLGLYEVKGVAGLIRKYELHWFFFGILTLAVLFVWRNSVYFIPPLPDNPGEELNDSYSKKDAIQGLISLLRRNIPAGEILRSCMVEWKKTIYLNKRQQTGELGKKIEEIDNRQILVAGKKDPVQGYRSICRILSNPGKESYHE